MLIISEAKLDFCFFSLIEVARGKVSCYMPPSKLIQTVGCKLDKAFFLVEINGRRKKWLLVCDCNSHETLIQDYCNVSVKKQIHYHENNTFILGNFNCEPNDESMTTFSEINGLKINLHEPTCYKNPNNSFSIDLIMKNRP